MKTLYSILLIACLIPLSCIAQNTSFSTPKSIKPFYVEMVFHNAKYVAYNKPLKFDMLTDTEFDKDHLKTPYSVIQSLLIATSPNWIDSLSIEQGKARLSSTAVSTRKSNEYRQKCKITILSELSFRYKEVEYIILQVNFNGLKESNNFLNPFMFTMTDKGWKIYSGELSELEGLLYVKPQVLEELLSGNKANSEELTQFKSHYFCDRRYNLSASPGLSAAYSFNTGSFNQTMLIGSKRYTPPNKDISIEIQDFGCIQRWSKSNGMFSKKDNTENPENHIWQQSIEPTYNQNSELALASWVFESNLEKKLQYVTNKELASKDTDISAINYTNEDIKDWSISIKYNLTFYGKEYEYCLIIYDKYTHQAIIRDQHTLLKNVKGTWYIETEKYLNSIAIQASRAITSLSPPTLEALFLETKSNSTESQVFISNITDCKSRIFVNTLSEKLMKYCTQTTCITLKVYGSGERKSYR